MAEMNKPTISHVAGFVMGPTQNRDNSVTFKIAGQRFTLSKKNDFVEMLCDAKRALVRFEAISKNPRIILVIPNPSTKLIRHYMEGN